LACILLLVDFIFDSITHVIEDPVKDALEVFGMEDAGQTALLTILKDPEGQPILVMELRVLLDVSCYP
jgi:hypothetical protein